MRSVQQQNLALLDSRRMSGTEWECGTEQECGRTWEGGTKESSRSRDL